MIRHPKNEHDELAIGVYLDETRIGWIPREYNPIISRLMDTGKAFFCRIDSAKRKNQWVKINVDVYMVE